METNLKQTIFQTFSEVFETMFFTFLEPLEEIPGKAELGEPGAYIEADIAFEGAKRGGVRFYFPSALARNITVNFLGVDEVDVNESQVLDTAKETANMAIGSLLGRIDPAGTIRLGLPQSKAGDMLPVDELLGHPGLFLFNTEHGLLWVVYEA